MTFTKQGMISLARFAWVAWLAWITVTVTGAGLAVFGVGEHFGIPAILAAMLAVALNSTALIYAGALLTTRYGLSPDTIRHAPNWRKSSHSMGNGNCAEIACGSGVVLVRDTKTRNVRLSFGTDTWQAFIREIKDAG